MLCTKGFSLLELLIVIAIMAIMVAIAYPTYKTYLVKARIAELFTLADAYRLRVVENNLDLVTNDEEEQVNSAYVATVAMRSFGSNPVNYMVQVVAKMRTEEEHGIGVVVPAGAEPLTITFNGVEQGSHIAWTCQVSSVYAKYVPTSCNHIS